MYVWNKIKKEIMIYHLINAVFTSIKYCIPVISNGKVNIIPILDFSVKWSKWWDTDHNWVNLDTTHE